jgi:hypothetical protein
MNNVIINWKNLNKFKGRLKTVVEDKPYTRMQIKTLPNSPLLRVTFDTITEINRPKPISKYIVTTMITSLLNRTGVRTINNKTNQRSELMQCHGMRKFFKTTCINAGMNPLYSEYLIQNILLDTKAALRSHTSSPLTRNYWKVTIRRWDISR